MTTPNIRPTSPEGRRQPTRTRFRDGELQLPRPLADSSSAADATSIFGTAISSSIASRCSAHCSNDCPGLQWRVQQ